MEESGESSTETSFALPYAETARFGPLFDELIKSKAALGVRSFGVSMTTLEEVFVRLSRLEEAHDAEDGERADDDGALAPTVSTTTTRAARMVSINAADDANATEHHHLLTGSSSDGGVRFTNGGIAGASGAGNGDDDDGDGDDGSDVDDSTPLMSAPQTYGAATGGGGAGGGDASALDDSCDDDGDARHGAGLWSVVRALMVIRFKQSIREWRALFFQVVVPAVLLVVSLTVIAKPEGSGSRSDAQPLLALSPALYSDNDGLTVPIAAAAGDAFLAGLNASSAFAEAGAHTMRLPADTCLQGSKGFLTEHARGFAGAFAVQSPSSSSASSPCGGGGGGGGGAFAVSNGSGVLDLYFNTTMVHAPAVYMAQVGNSFLSSAGASVQAASHPLPAKQELTWDASVFYTVLLLGMGLSVIPGGFAINTIKDRETKMKHLLEVSGVSAFVYWLADLLRSMAIFSFSVAFAIVLTVAVGVEPLVGPGLPLLVLMCITYMPLTILFAFLASYLFSDAETCQSVFPPLNNFLGFIPFIVVGTVDGVGSPNAARILHYVFCAVIPPYSLSGGLYYMFRLHTVASFNPDHPHATAQGVACVHVCVCLFGNGCCECQLPSCSHTYTHSLSVCLSVCLSHPLTHSPTHSLTHSLTRDRLLGNRQQRAPHVAHHACRHWRGGAAAVPAEQQGASACLLRPHGIL